MLTGSFYMMREGMGAEHDRDKWLERLLGRRPSRSATRPSDVCLDAETLAAWADMSLTAKALAAAEMHASNCSRCMALLAAIGRTAPPAVTESRSRGGLFRWLVPLAAAATAVAIWVAIPGRQPTPVAREESVPATSMASPQTTPPPETAKQLADPVPLEMPASQSKLGRQAQTARSDDQRVDLAPSVAQEARGKREAAESTTVTGESALARQPAAPAPARPASADELRDNTAALSARRALNETVKVVIEGASPDNPQVRWRSFSGNDVERSVDGGQTWTRTAASPPGTIKSIRVVDALNATITSSDGRSFVTTDGGATWAPVQEKPPAPF
jgi:hypothetical protein